MTRFIIGLILTLSFAFALEPAGDLLGPFPVARVVDGDTLILELPSQLSGRISEERVRLIGIDTPETVHPERGEEAFGREASDYAKAMLENQDVYLELDVQERDRYGRILGYVYLVDPNGTWTWEGLRLTQVNLAMLEAGLADLLTIAPNVRYVELYTETLRAVRAEGMGMWAGLEEGAECVPMGSECPASCPIKGSNSGIYHLPGGQFYSRTTNPAACFASEVDAVGAGHRRSER